jgi:hypothetical protein
MLAVPPAFLLIIFRIFLMSIGSYLYRNCTTLPYRENILSVRSL